MSRRQTKKSPSSTKQQTLEGSLLKQKLKKEHEEQLNAGRTHIMELSSQHTILEEKFVNTSAASYDDYRKESRMASSQGYAVSHIAVGSRRSQRKRNLAEAGLDEDGEPGLPVDEEEEDQGMEKAGRNRRWVEQGAAFVDELQMHITSDTALPIKYQELLMHMLLNADVHLGAPNLSEQALELAVEPATSDPLLTLCTLLAHLLSLKLLMLNVRQHPGAMQDSKHSHILYLNKDLWLPNAVFEYEKECHAAVCTSPMGTCCPKLSFMLELLTGTEKLVQQQQQQQQQQEIPDGRPGPLGCALVLQYVCHLLVDDFSARMKIFNEHSHKQPSEEGRLKGDLNAAKVLSHSMLAQLLSTMGNISSVRWTELVAQIVYGLVGLILEAKAPSLQFCQEGKQGKASSSRLSMAPAGASEAAGGQSVVEMSVAAAARAPSLARKMLCCMYDLFMVMEEEQQLPNKEEKDTDCRMLALTLQQLFVKSGVSCVPAELKTRMQEPSSKRILLWALSPAARAHLLTFVYAKASANRWQSTRGSKTVIPCLQPLKDYAERVTSVRLIWEEGPPKVNPVDLLRDLEIPDNFTSSYQKLLVNSNIGDGFVTWLTSFTEAVVMAAKQGKLDVDVAMLREAFNKVVVRLPVPKPAADCMPVEAKALEEDMIALARAKRVLSA